MTVYSSYTPNFKCSVDSNNKGIVSASIGLITYDEVVFAGGYYNKTNSNYYLYNNTYYWTMSPAGFSVSSAGLWGVCSFGSIHNDFGCVNDVFCLRSVLNLRADTVVTGSGTSIDPYVVQ